MNKTKIMESEPCRDTYHQTLTTLTGFPDQHEYFNGEITKSECCRYLPSVLTVSPYFF